MTQYVVVTGTSTGVGKTVATAALAATTPGCVVVKPAQTGGADGDSDARELLTTALFHEDSFVRSAAGLVLAQLGEMIATPSVVESLLVVLRDSDTYAREAAATALSAMGDLAATQATLETLTETLLDTDHFVHEAALTALGKLRPIYEANRLHPAPQEAVAS